jgi:hypothetical protein
LVELGTLLGILRSSPKHRTGLAFLVGNALSTTAGILLAGILPSGVEPGSDWAEPGPDFGLYAILAFPVSYLLSVIIEAPIFQLCVRNVSAKRIWTAVSVANALGYLVLVAVFLLKE